MRKVVVVASASGNGKTTLGRQLAERLAVPFVELDALVHGPDWVETPNDELHAGLELLLGRDGWVADGAYQHKLGDYLLDRADTVVWLDLPLHVWLPRLIRRTWRRVHGREQLWNGNRESLATALWGPESLFVWAIRSHFRRRREWPRALSRYDVVRLKTPRDVDLFLATAAEPPPVARPAADATPELEVAEREKSVVLSIRGMLPDGVYHWTATHPEWEGPVSAYAIDDGERLILIDPIAVPDDVRALFGSREVVTVLTSTWHERDAASLGFPVWAPAPDRPEEQLVAATRYAIGDSLFGMEAYPGREGQLDLVLWSERIHAVIAGDTLIDLGDGLEIPASWLPEGVTVEQVAAGLRPLLGRPVELVLPTHGEPADRAALARALA